MVAFFVSNGDQYISLNDFERSLFLPCKELYYFCVVGP